MSASRTKRAGLLLVIIAVILTAVLSRPSLGAPYAYTCHGVNRILNGIYATSAILTVFGGPIGAVMGAAATVDALAVAIYTGC